MFSRSILVLTLGLLMPFSPAASGTLSPEVRGQVDAYCRYIGDYAQTVAQRRLRGSPLSSTMDALRQVETRYRDAASVRDVAVMRDIAILVYGTERLTPTEIRDVVERECFAHVRTLEDPSVLPGFR